MADYARAGVLLSLSGRHHPGQESSIVGGVRYFTAPALCEEPFGYALVTIAGRQAREEMRWLKAVGTEDASILRQFRR